MKREYFLFVTLGLIVIFAAGTFSVAANPTQSQPCGNCHTTTGVLVLTSNTTGTVDATVGVPFGLTVYQTSYPGGDELVAIAMKTGWSDNNQFSFTEFGVTDGTTYDLNPAFDQVTVSFTLTPLAAGSWTIRLWTAGKQNMVGTSLDISVSVSEPITTTTTPTTMTTTTDTTSTSTSLTTTTTGTTSTTPSTDTGTSTPTQLGGSTLLFLAGGGAILAVVIIAIILKRGS